MADLAAARRALIGANLRARRGALGLSEQAITGVMNRAGFSWDRVLLAKIETGQRTLLAREGLILCPVLQASIEDLMPHVSNAEHRGGRA